LVAQQTALGSTNYPDAEVEPYVAVDPTNPSHLVASFQQNRRSDGGSIGLTNVVSTDAGAHWALAKQQTTVQRVRRCHIRLTWLLPPGHRPVGEPLRGRNALRRLMATSGGLRDAYRHWVAGLDRLLPPGPIWRPSHMLVSILRVGGHRAWPRRSPDRIETGLCVYASPSQCGS
jgi:hypothetical protein